MKSVTTSRSNAVNRVGLAMLSEKIQPTWVSRQVRPHCRPKEIWRRTVIGEAETIEKSWSETDHKTQTQDHKTSKLTCLYYKYRCSTHEWWLKTRVHSGSKYLLYEGSEGLCGTVGSLCTTMDVLRRYY